MNKVKMVITGFALAVSVVLNAGPYPGKAGTWTKVEKDKQREAGTALLKEIFQAIASGKKSFSIPNGVYRFGKTMFPNQPTHIEFRKIRNFKLECNNSWFYFDHQASALRFIKCGNFSLRNLNIDYDPLPYCQGTIVSIDDKSRPRSFIFRPDPGYLMPELLTEKKVAWRSKIDGNCRVMLWDRKTGLLKADQLGMNISRNNGVTKLADGNYRIDVNVWWGRSLKEAGLEIGDAATVWRRAGRAIRMELCDKMELDNVDIFSSGFVTYVGYLGKGPFIFRNCDLKVRPGTDRLVGSNADGFNVRGILNGTLLENCSAEALGDDFVNLQGVYYKVFEKISDKEYIVARTPEYEGKEPVWHFISGKPWKNPRLPSNKDSKSWDYLGKVKVIKKELCTYAMPKDRSQHKWASAGNYKPGQKYPAQKVTFDRPVNVDADAIFWSESCNVKGSVIRNCKFRNNYARGIRLQTINAVVENNSISYTTGPSMSFFGHPGFWGESTNCRNVIVRNNIFKYSGRRDGNAALVLKVEGNPETTQPIENIVIENNRIINPRGSAIELSGCENIKIINNTISGLKSRPFKKSNNPREEQDPESYGKPIIEGPGVKNIEISGNRIIK